MKKYAFLIIIISLLFLFGCSNNEKYKLKIEKDGEGVVSESSKYEEGEEVLLTATANDGFRFDGWYIDNEKISDKNSFSYTMPNEDKTVKAIFIKIKNTYSLKLIANGEGEVNGAGDYEEGVRVDAISNPKSGYKFDGWYNGDTCISYKSTYSFIINENTELIAKFSIFINEVSIDVYTNCTDNAVVDEIKASYSTGKPYILNEPDYSRYVNKVYFMGWSTEKTLTEDSKVTEITDNSITKLYAIYGVKIKFVDIDGTSVEKYIEYDTEIASIENDNPYKNYEFIGWDKYVNKLAIKDGTVYAKYNLIKDNSVDKRDFVVYEEDSLITYDFFTVKEVDKVSLTFFDLDLGYYDDPEYFGDDIKSIYINNPFLIKKLRTLNIDENNLCNELTDAPKENEETIEGNSKYIAKRTETADGYHWTISWNLGQTAIKYIVIESFITEFNTSQVILEKMNVRYPTLNYNDGLESIINKFVKYNLDVPILFNIDINTVPVEKKKYLTDFFLMGTDIFREEELMIISLFHDSCNKEIFSNEEEYPFFTIDELSDKEYYKYISNRSICYGGGFLNGAPNYNIVLDYPFTCPQDQIHAKALNNLVLMNHYTMGKTFSFYSDISCEARAIIAYLNDFEIDKEKFNNAYEVLNAAKPVLNKIINDNMTDFEKEKAIYTWMMEVFNSGTLKEPLNMDHVKTAYGFLTGYYGDCMGWSATFYTLCNMANVKCRYVDTQAIAGGPLETFNANHRLNIVMLDDEFYFVDIFWFYQKTSEEDGDWRYFNMTSNDASMHYTWITSKYFGPPVCDSLKYTVDEVTGMLKEAQ